MRPALFVGACIVLWTAAPLTAAEFWNKSVELPSGAAHSLAAPLSDLVGTLQTIVDPAAQVRFIREQAATSPAARLAGMLAVGDETALDAEFFKDVRPEQSSLLRSAMKTYQMQSSGNPALRRELETLDRVLKGAPEGESAFDGAPLKPARILSQHGREGPSLVRALSARGGRLLINGKEASAVRPAATRDGVVGETLLHPDDPGLLVKVYHDPRSLGGYDRLTRKIARLEPLSAAGAAPELLESGEAEVAGRGLVHFYVQRNARGLKLAEIPHGVWPLEAIDRLFERLKSAGLELEVPGPDKEWLASHLLVFMVDARDENRAYVLDGASERKAPESLDGHYDMLRSLIRPTSAPAADEVPVASAGRLVTHPETSSGQQFLRVVLTASSEEALERVLSSHRLSERSNITGIAKSDSRREASVRVREHGAADLAFELLNDPSVARVEAFGDVESQVYGLTRGALSRLQDYDGGAEWMHVSAPSRAALRDILKRQDLESRAPAPSGQSQISIPIAPGWDPTETIVALLNDPDLPSVGASSALRLSVENALRARGLLPGNETRGPAPSDFEKRAPERSAANRRFPEKLATIGASDDPGSFIVHWWSAAGDIAGWDFIGRFVPKADLHVPLGNDDGYRVKISPEWTPQKLALMLHYPSVTRLEVPAELRAAIEAELSKPAPAAVRTAPVHAGIEKLSLISDKEYSNGHYVVAALEDTSRVLAFIERHELQTQVSKTYDPKTNALVLKTVDIQQAADLAAKLMADPEAKGIRITELVKRLVQGRFRFPAFDEEIVGPAAHFVKIPAGEFEMGPERRKVTLRAHEMQLTPVTQEQYESVMGINPSTFHTMKKSAIEKLLRKPSVRTLRAPVETLSWVEAQRFILRLNLSQDEYTYRMPTEAEWERAAHVRRMALVLLPPSIYAANSQGRTWDVTRYDASRDVVNTLAGVRVWVEDAYEERLPGEGSASPLNDPLVIHLPAAGRLHVTRGASWADGVEALDPTYRTFARFDERSDEIGLQLVREPRP